MKNYVILAFMMLPLMSYSQSIFLDKGKSAGSLEIGIGNVEEDAEYTIGGRYSIKGRTDIFLSYEKSGFDVDADLNRFKFGADYLLFKQGGKAPINWNLGASYSLGKFSSDEFTSLGIDYSLNELKLSSGFSRVIGTSFLITPYASIDYHRLNANVTDGDDSFSESDDGINYTLGGHLGFYLGESLISLNPYASFGYLDKVGLRLSFTFKAK